MIEFEFENNGSLEYEVTLTNNGAKIRFFGKNYSTNNLTNVNYISFNGIWELKFTEQDIKNILKKKLT
jgi:hypothetical protein